MKQFRILLMTLMFTIFSFASVSQAENVIIDDDVGYEQAQGIHQVNLISDIDSQMIYQLKNMSDIFSLKIEKVGATDSLYIFPKVDNKVYKEPIKIVSLIFIRQRNLLNIIYTT